MPGEDGRAVIYTNDDSGPLKKKNNHASVFINEISGLLVMSFGHALYIIRLIRNAKFIESVV